MVSNALSQYIYQRLVEIFSGSIDNLFAGLTITCCVSFSYHLFIFGPFIQTTKTHGRIYLTYENYSNFQN